MSEHKGYWILIALILIVFASFNYALSDTNLIAYYDFNNDTGNILTDLVNGDNNGANTNTSLSPEGKFGNTYYFNNNGFSALTNTGFSTGTTTIAFWLKTNAVGANDILYSQGTRNVDGITIENEDANPANELYGFVRNQREYSSFDVSDLNDWVFIILDYNEVGYSTLINNSVFNSKSVSGSINIATPKIGTYGTDYYTGFIDEMSIWSRILTPTEKTELYNSATGLTYCEDRVGYTKNSDFNTTCIYTLIEIPGIVKFTLYDENDLSLLNGVTIDYNGTPQTLSSNTFDFNISNITSGTYTFSLTKTGYESRYYVVDLNNESALNVDFGLLPTSLSTSVPLKVYKTDETTVFSNTYVELYLPNNNLIIGRQKTNNLGETTFSLHTTDQNYYAQVNNGEFTYQPVTLTILYPKNEDTLTQITENWKIEITNNLFLSYTDLNADKIVYLLPNTASAFNIKISDMNNNYFSRTYAKQYPGNPLTDSLQPYLVPIDTGLLTTIKTISTYTNEPISEITIKIYKNIASIGRTLVEQIVTDSKGEALVLLNLNNEYEFEIYDQDLVYIRTDNITSTSSTIYVTLSIIDFVDPTLNTYLLTQAYNPARTKLITTDTQLIQTTTITNDGTDVNISKITYVISNTDVNGTGTDKNLIVLSVIPTAKIYQKTWDLNQTAQTINGVWYDTNGFIKVSIIVELNDGNLSLFNFIYKPITSFDWQYNVGVGIRNIFGCSNLDPDIPCPTMLLAALFFSILITIALAMQTGFNNMEGMGFILIGILGIFTYFNWVPYLLYGIIVVCMIVIGIAMGGKKI